MASPKTHRQAKQQQRLKKTRKLQRGFLRPGPCQCRPRIGTKRPAYGCLPETELQNLAKVLPVRFQGGNKSTEPLRKLRNDIANHIGANPEDEATFIDKLPISTDEKQRLLKNYLRPRQPLEWKSDPDMWLDSNNIRDVMTQYEEDIPHFEFLGPFPIDFAAPDPYQKSGKHCLVGEICKLDLKDLKHRGKTSIGIIYNLDPHYKSGSHWVGNYIDLKKNCCYYFDSYGMEAPPQVQKFMQWLTLQRPGMTLAYNARRHQFKGSECGMYSMYFIICMLLGEDFLHFCRRAPRDGSMLELRGWLFSK
jgi:hypothetical protein